MFYREEDIMPLRDVCNYDNIDALLIKSQNVTIQQVQDKVQEVKDKLPDSYEFEDVIDALFDSKMILDYYTLKEENDIYW